MNIHKIISKRKYGRIRINYIGDLCSDLNKLLLLNGLFIEKQNLIKIDFHQAKNVVVRLLNYDIAYDLEIMPIEIAQEYTDYLFQDLNEENCICFTNGEWDQYGRTNSFKWNSFTKSTFDGGILVNSNNFHFCFWVEEED